MECLLCGIELKEEELKKYCCCECEKKIQLITKLKQVDNAAEKMQKSCHRYSHKIINYQKEKNTVVDKIKNNGFVFNSIPEICVALQLEKENIKYIPNFKIDRHKVDFFLPDLKRIIEVDGELYHTDESKEFLRERMIMRIIGEQYEIVRIPSKYVPNYIIRNLKESIEFVIDKRNFDRRFRDTRWDGQYWCQYYDLNRYVRTGGKK